jgi:hypothetical protein
MEVKVLDEPNKNPAWTTVQNRVKKSTQSFPGQLHNIPLVKDRLPGKTLRGQEKSH